MLTEAQFKRGLTAGAASLALIGIFVTLPTASLLLAVPGTGTGAGAIFDAYTLEILRFTLLQAILSTLLSVGLAVPVAISLARRPRFVSRTVILRLMAVPMGLPALIGALGLIGIFGRQGLVNDALAALGLQQPISLYGLGGILLAHVFFNLPLAARLLLTAIERLPAEYWRLSASLGMSPWSVLRFIEAPALLRVIPGVASLVFMLCATSFTLVLVLGGGPAATTLEVAIYQALRFDFDPPRAVSLALLQILLTGLILCLLFWLAPKASTGASEGRAIRRFDAQGRAAVIVDATVIALATLFLVLPLLSILVAGLRADLARLLTLPEVWQAGKTSLSIAVTAAFLSLGLASGIILSRSVVQTRRRPSRALGAFSALLAVLSSLVLLVPPVVLGTGWFLLLRPVVNLTAAAPFLIAAINALMALPFVMRVLEPAVEAHLARTRRLSASLAIHGWSRFRRVDWPILKRPIFMALSFAMALSLGDLGAVALFGSHDLVTLPWLIYSRLGSYRTHDADGLALILGIVCLILTLLGTAGNKDDRP
ncbi:thiamine/thiamine pyrophosphate ABC transporter permease [Rhizobium sp. SSA_523]|uniref:thiamine/thiamine pyrophosphate ABC transporter permease n=1 Tax=Rhizobium sp. SSA_523 TaxID=2952477 RepID=UPI002090D0AE|nr:thiamine/thiamine pyrophosphate ABC transporter permease [Rhizobium sp. SSA_523]MCO5733484.1 thiamine/thiamine pyrophosphate ABC transporter permease [Rhizobium sp. SSA_523]WKC23211.1 thiamine/thiamine pyrophosphate ABC transporter permease [Rhizobium sp. SSA_523]